jgi:hypothetical protein
MKLHLLTLFSLIGFTVFSQSLFIDHQEYYFSAFGEQCYSELDVTNVSSQDISVNITRTVTTDISNYFCWGITCYIPNSEEVFTTNTPVLIPAGETLSGADSFKGYVNNLPEESSLVVNYCFWIEGIPDDETCIDLTYTNKEMYTSLPEISIFPEIFPNPAVNELTIIANEGVKSEFLLFDMLGNKVLYKNIQNSTIINISSLESGIYFYSFCVQGKVSKVQKLVISN